MIPRGEPVFRAIRGGRRLRLKFEDIEAAPRERLPRLIRFIDPSLENEARLRQAPAVPRLARSSYQRLPEAEQHQHTEL
jgi:hypothetical protein